MQAPLEYCLPQFPAHSSAAETLESKALILGMGRDWDVLHPFTVSLHSYLERDLRSTCTSKLLHTMTKSSSPINEH